MVDLFSIRDMFNDLFKEDSDDVLLKPTSTNIQVLLKDAKIDVRFLKQIFREMLIMKFNHAGFYTRQFYNENLSKIFIVVKAQDIDLRQRAEVEEMSK